jgi:hypothetical protein
VFLDQSGRRRRLVVAGGVALGVMLLAGLLVLLAGFSGASGLHVPGFPDANSVDGELEPTPDATDTVTDEPASFGTDPAVGPSESASPDRTSPRRIPTQTPSHEPPPKPTKT